MTISRNTLALKEFCRENGKIELLRKIAVVLTRRWRDTFVAKQIARSRMYLGKGPKIYGRRHLAIGSGFSAGDWLWLEAVVAYRGIKYSPMIEIGNDVAASDFVHIAATNRVVIGDGVLIGSRVLISDHSHGDYRGVEQVSPTEPPNLRRLSCDRTVTIGRNVWIGDGVAILPGTNIGEGSIIGANSVVNGTIPANCIAVGTPARPIRVYDLITKTWKRIPQK